MTIPESPVTIAVDESTVSGVYARPEKPTATLVVAHGAGAGMEHPFLAGFTRAVNVLGDRHAPLQFPLPGGGPEVPRQASRGHSRVARGHG